MKHTEENECDLFTFFLEFLLFFFGENLWTSLSTIVYIILFVFLRFSTRGLGRRGDCGGRFVCNLKWVQVHYERTKTLPRTASSSSSFCAFPFFPLPFLPFLPFSFERPHSSSARSSAVTSTGALSTTATGSSSGGSSKSSWTFLAFFLSFLPFVVDAFMADYVTAPQLSKASGNSEVMRERTIRPPKSSFSSTSGGPSSCIERTPNAEDPGFALDVGALSASDSAICSVARLLFATDWPALSLYRLDVQQ